MGTTCIWWKVNGLRCKAWCTTSAAFGAPRPPPCCCRWPSSGSAMPSGAPMWSSALPPPQTCSSAWRACTSSSHRTPWRPYRTCFGTSSCPARHCLPPTSPARQRSRAAKFGRWRCSAVRYCGSTPSSARWQPAFGAIRKPSRPPVPVGRWTCSPSITSMWRPARWARCAWWASPSICWTPPCHTPCSARWKWPCCSPATTPPAKTCSWSSTPCGIRRCCTPSPRCCW